MSITMPKALSRLAVQAAALALAFAGSNPTSAKEELNPFTTYPTEMRFVSFDKHSAHLSVRSRANRHAQPFYYPQREAAPTAAIIIKATSDRPVYDMKREFRFQQRYDMIVESLDYLPAKLVMEKIHRAMKEGAGGDTRFPFSEKVDTFNLARLPRDAVEMSILEHLHWMDDYLEDRSKSNSFFSSVNTCMILTYKLDPNASKRYSNYFDIRITFEREVKPDGKMDIYMLAQADPTYTCNFGEFVGG